MAAGYPIHGFVHITMRTVQLFLVLGFRIHGSGTIRLNFTLIIEEWVISRGGGVSRHVMRSLSIVIIGVVSVHVSSFWLDQALLAS